MESKRITIKRGNKDELPKASFLDGEIAVIKDTKELIVCIDGKLYGCSLRELELEIKK